MLVHHVIVSQSCFIIGILIMLVTNICLALILSFVCVSEFFIVTMIILVSIHRLHGHRLVLMWRIINLLQLLVSITSHILIVLVSLLLNATLLRNHYFLHLLDGNCTLHVNPLTLNDMLLLQFQYQVDAVNVIVSHKAKSPWFVGPLVLQNDAIFNLTKVTKICLETMKFKVVR